MTDMHVAVFFLSGSLQAFFSRTVMTKVIEMTEITQIGESTFDRSMTFIHLVQVTRVDT